MYMEVFRGISQTKTNYKKDEDKGSDFKTIWSSFFFTQIQKAMFFAGAVGDVFAIYLMSCIIWNIHIEGNFMM